ncbi:MAG: DNA/pantothenate metabolism flavoprotein domain protein [Verrucomicrobia bacterium]|nr:DNA/pantothenate metabolism flavoprotein domain protein [Verrucomicrobiota bacterium]
MKCLITAGPTYEPLDGVRRLTNFSSGRLGSELASFLTARGHETTLLIGQQATFRGERHASKVETFTTTANLHDRLQSLAGQPVDALFHAAAVSDFTVGKVWRRAPQGELTEVHAGKLSTREGTLLAELVPTPKIIAELREWFPHAWLVGWKYEVEGGRAGVIQLAERQVADNPVGCKLSNPKPEARPVKLREDFTGQGNPKEIRNQKSEGRAGGCPISDFGFRISVFHCRVLEDDCRSDQSTDPAPCPTRDRAGRCRPGTRGAIGTAGDSHH